MDYSHYTLLFGGFILGLLVARGFYISKIDKLEDESITMMRRGYEVALDEIDNALEARRNAEKQPIEEDDGFKRD